MIAGVSCHLIFEIIVLPTCCVPDLPPACHCNTSRRHYDGIVVDCSSSARERLVKSRTENKGFPSTPPGSHQQQSKGPTRFAKKTIPFCSRYSLADCHLPTLKHQAVAFVVKRPHFAHSSHSSPSSSSQVIRGSLNMLPLPKPCRVNSFRLQDVDLSTLELLQKLKSEDWVHAPWLESGVGCLVRAERIFAKGQARDKLEETVVDLARLPILLAVSVPLKIGANALVSCKWRTAMRPPSSNRGAFAFASCRLALPDPPRFRRKRHLVRATDLNSSKGSPLEEPFLANLTICFVRHPPSRCMFESMTHAVFLLLCLRFSLVSLQPVFGGE